jgi:hypothetical protein
MRPQYGSGIRRNNGYIVPNIVRVPRIHMFLLPSNQAEYNWLIARLVLILIAPRRAAWPARAIEHDVRGINLVTSLPDCQKRGR